MGPETEAEAIKNLDPQIESIFTDFWTKFKPQDMVQKSNHFRKIIFVFKQIWQIGQDGLQEAVHGRKMDKLDLKQAQDDPRQAPTSPAKDTHHDISHEKSTVRAVHAALLYEYI